MMAIHIPPDMIPRVDWNAEDKQAAWAFYRERLEQYFMIAGTPNEAKVTHMIEVAKAHERTCQEYQIHKQPPVTTPIL